MSKPPDIYTWESITPADFERESLIPAKVYAMLSAMDTITRKGKPLETVNIMELMIALLPPQMEESDTVLVGLPEDLHRVRINPQRRIAQDNAIQMALVDDSEEIATLFQAHFDMGILGDIRTATDHTSTAWTGSGIAEVFDDNRFIDKPFNIIFIGIEATHESTITFTAAGITATFDSIPILMSQYICDN